MNTNPKTKSKIICVGWHKTGTSTMGDALLALGYTVLGARLDLSESLLIGDISKSLHLAKDFEALQDVPWAALYQELDKTFPGAKFILTIRDEQKWLHSAKKHFKDNDIPMHQWLYGQGILEGNESLYLGRYQKHNLEVLQYFQDRPNDFLIINLEQGDGWKKLCPFLGVPIPNKKFPHSNKGQHSYDWRDKTIDFLRKLMPLGIRKWRVETMMALGFSDRRNRFNNAKENREERLKRKSLK